MFVGVTQMCRAQSSTGMLVVGHKAVAAGNSWKIRQGLLSAL